MQVKKKDSAHERSAKHPRKHEKKPGVSFKPGENQSVEYWISATRAHST
jgi:hypothetical protein